MGTNDKLTLLTLVDLIVRRIANNRMGVYRLMARENDPFPQPILLNDGKQQRGSHRVSGRRVAWRASEVEAWLERRTRLSGSGTAA